MEKVKILFEKYNYCPTTETITETGDVIAHINQEQYQQNKIKCITELKTYTAEEIQEFLDLLYNKAYNNGCEYTEEFY